MQRIVYLARHGETDWNREKRWQGHTDVALNDEGRQQARELADALRGLGVAHACASDLSRARETAEIVAHRLGLSEVSVDAALREREFGVFEGLTETECVGRYPEEWASYRRDPKCPPPSAEHYDAVARRMREAIERAAEKAENACDAVLIVSHGGAMRAFMQTVTGDLPSPLGNGATFRMTFEHGAFRAVERLR